jgi:GT2 family glycosyltransferase
LQAAIENILFHTQHPFILFLVESGSTDGTDKVCDHFARKYRNIVAFHTPKEGITKAINFGIKQAGTRDVYLTQDDVILPGLYGRDWLTELVNISKTIKKIGLVTTIKAGGVSGPSYIDGFTWIGTWSMYIPRSTIDKVGLLDENFSPGPGDDIDYTYRVVKAGLKLFIANFWVDHHRMTENFNDDVPEIKKRNSDYFRKKHNIDNELGSMRLK